MKKQKAIFDLTFYLNEPSVTDTWTQVSFGYKLTNDKLTNEDFSYVVRIECEIIEETEESYKVQTHSFFRGYYGYLIISYPKSNHSRPRPYVKTMYWVDKKDIKLLK